MAIHTRMGSKVSIIANCGQHQPKGFKTPATLVRVKFEGGEKRYQFAPFLRAVHGYQEIESAIEKAPVISLTDAELASAIKQAL